MRLNTGSESWAFKGHPSTWTIIKILQFPMSMNDAMTQIQRCIRMLPEVQRMHVHEAGLLQDLSLIHI